jgi:hypothetical protein
LRHCLNVLLIAAAVVLMMATVAAQEVEDTIRIKTRVVFLDALVKDKRTNLPISNLASENFEVLDNGKPRNIAYFTREGQARKPLALILILDLREDGGLFDAYQHALFVHATVMSAPASDRRVIDAGLKTFAMDAGMPTPWKLDGAVYHRPSDEHGILDVSACDRPPARGTTVLLVPGHCDPTVNLHDWYVGVRNGRVEVLWPVSARGAST